MGFNIFQQWRLLKWRYFSTTWLPLNTLIQIAWIRVFCQLPIGLLHIMHHVGLCIGDFIVNVVRIAYTFDAQARASYSSFFSSSCGSDQGWMNTFCPAPAGPFIENFWKWSLTPHVLHSSHTLFPRLRLSLWWKCGQFIQKFETKFPLDGDWPNF